MREITRATLNENLNPIQQVLVLRDASLHPKTRAIFKSAGLIDVEDYEALKYQSEQIQKMLKLATETKHARERTNDDRRSFTHGVSIACAPTSDSLSKIPKRKHAEMLGLSGTTFNNQMKVVAEKRRAIEAGDLDGSWEQIKKERNTFNESPSLVSESSTNNNNVI